MIEDDFLSNFTGAAEQMGNGRKIMVVAVGEEPPSIKASRTQSNPYSRGPPTNFKIPEVFCKKSQ